MALFKIFNNIDSQNTTLPSTYTKGYMYYDAKESIFYIDTAGEGGTTGARQKINAWGAEKTLRDSLNQQIDTTYIKGISISNNQLSYTTGDGTSHTVEGTLGAVTGVKGNAETTYRTGQVNLTPANIGAATSGHTHTTTIATDNGTNQLTLAFDTKYKLTAGGTSYIFTMPANPDTNTASAVDNILHGSNSGTAITYAPYTSRQSGLSFDTTTTNPNGTDRLNLNGYLYATKLYSDGKEVLTAQSLTNYKTKQSEISSATDETDSATRFVYSITQNDNGVINVKTRPLPTYNNYTLPTATTSIKGGVVIGSNINVDTDGKISIDNTSITTALGYTPYNSSNPNGYTNNVGTITGIKMNGASKGTSGVVDLGTVITDVSGKLDKSGGTITGDLILEGDLTLNGDPTDNLHAATKQYVDNAFTTNDALVFKGTLGASNDGATVTSLPNTHKQGWTYKVVTAGTYAGQECEIGDTIYCITDGTTANNDHWTIVQTNIDGYVIGPSTSTTNGIATYSGVTGRGLSDSGKTITTSAPTSSSNDTTIPTSKAVWSAITGAPGYGETGTVTSVAASGSNGITISGSPITSSGTITIGLNLSTAINGLGEGTSPANRNDYAVVQYAGGGTTTTTYHRRKLSNVFAALNSSDITDALGYTPYNATNPDGYTNNTGTVTKVSTGAGLTGGDITGTGTIKANLMSETKLTNAATDGTETSGRVYPIRLDKNGKLAVNVPWTNTNTWDANSKDVAGYVAAPGDVANKVWKTDANGNPAWRDDANTTYSSKAAASEGTAVSLVTTGEKYIWNNKSIVSISRNLTSGTKIGTITINGTDTDLYCETNTNTDTKVQQSVSSTEKWRKILLHNTQDNTSTTAVTDATDKVYAAVGVSVQPSTGAIRAGQYNIMDKVSLIFNSTTNALDFVFA